MSTDTLPPGWTGNDSDHHAKAGTVFLHVWRERRFNAFVRQHQRVGPYLWSASLGTANANGGTVGTPTAPESRAAAILAARIMAAEITQGCDWLTTHAKTETPE